MKGEYSIEVYNKRVKYKLNVKRNITILTGDSGIGKTTLVKLIDSFYNNGKQSGITLECEKICIYLHGKDWYEHLQNIKDSIVFIDEDSNFIRSDEFARAIMSTDNYYVLITRADLAGLPYSIKEIYTLKVNKSKSEASQVYNEQCLLYGEHLTNSGVYPDKIITEDSNSGHDFFKEICKDFNKVCIPANGKSNIKNIINNSNSEEKILIIADGAAFGCEMKKCMQALREHGNTTIYLPESFEWLLLKAGTVKNNELNNILENPSEYIDSVEYFSWERYFTSKISEICLDMPNKVTYTKSRLHSFFLSKYNKELMLKLLDFINFK